MVVVAVGVDGFTPEVSPVLPEAVPPAVFPVLGEVPMLLDEPDVPEPEAPIELVLPDVLEVPEVPEVLLSVLAVPVLPPVAGVVEPVVLGVVVLEELVDVLGVVPAVSVRLLQAPSEITATSASAAADVRDAFMGRTP